jgi:hypothetical protein
MYDRHLHWATRRALLPTCVVLVALLATGAARAEAKSKTMAKGIAAEGHSISGVWWAAEDSPALHPANGEEIPLSPQGRALYDKSRAEQLAGRSVDKARHTCLPQGTPRVMTTRYPFEIVLTPGQVSMLFEENRIYRTVRLNVAHEDPETWDPSFMGESVGRWDGQALLVDTSNFKPDTYLDDSGLPHSDKLAVSERLSQSRQGSELEALITITDPIVFMKPWTARIVYQRRTDVELVTDWVCGESHRDLSARRGQVPR